MAAPYEFLKAVLGLLWEDAQNDSLPLLDALKSYRRRALGGGLSGAGGEMLGHPLTSASGGGFSSSRMVPTGRSATEAAESAAALIDLYNECSAALTSASVTITDALIYAEMNDRLAPIKHATGDFSRIADSSPVAYPASQIFG